MYIRRLSEETIMPTDYSKLKANGFMLQKQKDTFSMRLRVLGGNISVEQLDTISKVAKKYAQGYVHLTSRQGVEIPFVKLEDIDAIVEELRVRRVRSSRADRYRMPRGTMLSERMYRRIRNRRRTRQAIFRKDASS